MILARIKGYDHRTKHLIMNEDQTKIDTCALRPLCPTLSTSGALEFLDDLQNELRELIPELVFDYYGLTIGRICLEMRFATTMDNTISRLAAQTKFTGIDLEAGYSWVFQDLYSYAGAAKVAGNRVMPSRRPRSRTRPRSGHL